MVYGRFPLWVSHHLYTDFIKYVHVETQDADKMYNSLKYTQLAFYFKIHIGLFLARQGFYFKSISEQYDSCRANKSSK